MVSLGVYIVYAANHASHRYERPVLILCEALVAVPILLLVSMYHLDNMGFATINLDSITTKGALLAGASGAIASGIGYSIWYTAMPLLKNTQAAIVQLCVPIIAAILGVIFLSEQLSYTIYNCKHSHFGRGLGVYPK